MKTQICNQCHKSKPLKEFYFRKDSKSYRKNCKQCQLAQQKKGRLKNIWHYIYYDIKRRCENKNRNDFKDYGGRGIKCLITEIELKKLWFLDRAFEMKLPTIDREDNNGNYTFENCHFIEKGENSAKRNKINTKIVLQFDLDGTFIREWTSIKNIERELQFLHTAIGNCLKGRSNTSYGFIWKYKLFGGERNENN